MPSLITTVEWYSTHEQIENRAFGYHVPFCSFAEGPVAQRLELTTHNRSVPGSNPGRPM